MADDLGYNDVSSYGSQKMRTPVLDKLAAQGVRLTSFYAGAAVCTPARMALLSGAYPARLGWEGGVVGHGMTPGTGLSTDVYTIADAFKAAGYRTAMSGKWHVGVGKLLPMHQGFDKTWYIRNSNNMNRDLFRNGKLVHENYDNRRLTETFTEEAVRIINQESDKPLFLYIPFTAPHFPADAHPEWQGHSDNDAYGDVVEELDYRVGQILEALDRRGIADETIVVFTSDNGPEGLQSEFASAEPFSGGKWSSYEGGTRVPGIVRYPGVIESGRTSDVIVLAIDLFPTLAAACGVAIDLPAGAQKLDGVNVWETLVDNDAAPTRTELLYWHGFGKPTAIRRGDWKLFFDAGQRHGVDPDVTDGPLLFNLAEDPAETTDVSAEHPDTVLELLDAARQTLADIERHRVPIGQAE